MKKKLKESLSILLLVGMLIAIGLLLGKPAKSANETVSLLTYGDAGHGGNDTAVFQKALDSVAGQNLTLLVPMPTTSPYLVKPLFVRSNTTLELASGVVVQAASGYGLNDRLLNIEEVTNVTVTGTGATLNMPKAEYTSGEHRHALAIIGSTDITITGIACNNSGGDGIYIGVELAGGGLSAQLYNSNVVIQNVTANNNRRQGMSIISAQNLLVSHSRFTNTNGTSPQDGIDIEPNVATDRLVNIRIEDSVTTGNAGDGIGVNPGDLNSTSQPVSITISNHVDSNPGNSGAVLANTGKPDSATGSISFINFTSHSAPKEGIYIYRSGNVKVYFSNLTITNPAQAGVRGFDDAISFEQPAIAGVPCGNVFIPSSIISDSTGKMNYYFRVQDYSGLGCQQLQIAHGTWSGAYYDPYGKYLGALVTSVEVPATDPTITKTVDKTSSSSGETLTYTIYYSNPTTNTYTNTKIEDPIPNGTIYIDNSATSGATFDGNKIILNLGNLAAGSSGSIQFQVRVQ